MWKRWRLSKYIFVRDRDNILDCMGLNGSGGRNEGRGFLELWEVDKVRRAIFVYIARPGVHYLLQVLWFIIELTSLNVWVNNDPVINDPAIWFTNGGKFPLGWRHEMLKNKNLPLGGVPPL